MIMRIFALIALGVMLSTTALIAANPAIIWGSGGYAENLAPTGIKMKSGRVLDADANGIQTDLDFEVGRDLDVIGFSTLDNTLVSSNNGTVGLQINHSGSADALNINKSGSGEAIESIGEIKFKDTSGGLDPFVRIMNNAESATYFSVNASGMQLNGGSRVTTILDEDNMVSNSATALATQQSIKAYVDAVIPSQTSQGGKVLTTNGSTASWIDVDDRTNVIKNNLLECSNFDGCGSTEWVVVTDATLNGSGTSTRTDEVAANNVNYLRIEGISIPAADYDIKATLTKSQDFEGKQMLAFCEVKTLRPDTFFIVGANGVEQSRREVINDGSWRYYEIPFVGGDTSQFIEINGETTASQEPISIDNCFMGKVSPDYFARISGAQFVGSVSFSGCTAWTSTSTSFVNTTATTGCTYSTQGELQAPSTQILGVVIPNAQVGTYQITYNGKYGNGANAAYDAKVRFTDGTNFSSQANAQSPYNANSNSGFTTTLRITSSGTKTVQAQILSGNASFATFIEGNPASIEVYYFPDSTNTIVTQNTELTAQSANEFVASVSSTGVVSGENFDWINGNCTNATPSVCAFMTNIFNEKPSCTATLEKADGGEISVITTLSNITVYRHSSNGTAEARGFNLKCTRSTDYRKHATIVGKFENINSSELCQVIAQGNDGEVITGTSTEDIPFKTIVKDNCNNWSNAGNTGNNTNDAYTAKRDSVVLVNTQIRTTADVNQFLDYRVNGVTKRICGSRVSTTEHSSSCLVSLLKDDVLTVRFLVGNNPTLSSSLSHEIQITELPDTESIIKNLSTQKTKCQTKFLSANVNTNTTISALGFSNLQIGKKYRVNAHARSSRGTSTLDNFNLNAVNNGVTVMGITMSRSATSSVESNYGTSLIFDAASSSLSITSTGIDDTNTNITGNGTVDQTWVELCELPDTYVKTTEW